MEWSVSTRSPRSTGDTILDAHTQPSLLKCPLPPRAETGGFLWFPPDFSPQTLARGAEDAKQLLI